MARGYTTICIALAAFASILGGCAPQFACVEGDLDSGAQQCHDAARAECEDEGTSSFYADFLCDDLECEDGGWRAPDEECPTGSAS